MSFLKKVGRKWGVSRKRPAEGSESRSTTPSSSQQELGVPIASDSRAVTPDVQQHKADRDSTRNEEQLTQNGNQISISGGTFTNVGRDLIQNQFITEESTSSKLFEALNPVPAAHDCEVVNSKISGCFTGTRQQLLHDLGVWRATGTVPIYILDGIAGIGKSTIIKSFCADADAQQRLAASWFFSRDEQDRKTTRGFVRTLAYQLATHHPVLRERIAQVLKAQPDILQKAIRMQFEALIDEPLRGVFETGSEAHTISIDAMDECNINEAVELLSMLLSMIPQHPGLRLLVTCRPERPFRLLLQKHQAARVFHLHEIENSVVEADIRLYINFRLSPEQIDEALPDLLPPRWRASPEEKEALVQMAGKLFIIASTTISFVLDPLRMAPAKQMAQLLDAKIGRGLVGSPMDRLYIQVLRAAVPERVGDWFQDYQVVVGSIVVAADVLSIQSLASLLDIEPNGIVSTLSHLHSLIAPTRDNDAFHVHHKSFPDFVTDESRCSVDPRFFIRASERHFHLAQHCLRIMIKMLKQNICELPRSAWSTEASQLPPGSKDRIPPELAYACGYWILHIQEGLPHLARHGDVIAQLKIFVDQHLLSWLEVMAWTNRFDTAWGNVSLLSERLLLPMADEATPAPALIHVTSVLRDLLRFISLHPELPQTLPMHIYLSTLPFAPSESMIQQLYAAPQDTKQAVAVVAGLEQHWDPIAVTIHESLNIIDMELSPCGTMIATRTDHLRLYNAKSGLKLRSLRLEEDDHPDVNSVTFSSDSCWIVATKPDGVQIWDVICGELVASCSFPMSSTEFLDLPSSSYPVVTEEQYYDAWNPNKLHATSLIFTADRSAIAAGTVDGRLLLWQIGEPEAVVLQGDQSLTHPCDCLPEGIGQGCWVHRIAKLVIPSDSPIVVGVTQGAVQFWDRITHKYMKGISRCGQVPYTDPVSASPDNTMLALDSDPSTISIYSIHTQHHVCDLAGHQGKVTTTGFAPQNYLCSASEDKTIRLWNITTASQLKCIQTAFVLTDTLFSSALDTFVLAERGVQGQMVRLSQDECIAFGPSHFRGELPKGPQLAADGSIIASYHCGNTKTWNPDNSVLVTSIWDFVETASPTGGLDLPQTSRFGYLPSGVLVALYCLDELESPLMTSEGAMSLTVTVKRSMFEGISHDMSRVFVIDESLATFMVYNTRSGKQEARLPLPPLDAAYEPPGHNSVYFSWDNSSVYLQRRDDRLYIAQLPQLTSESVQDESIAELEFSEICGVPRRIWIHLQADGVPQSLEPHFVAEDSVWVWLKEEKTWTQMHPPSLAVDKIRRIAYSPSGAFIALAIPYSYDDFRNVEAIDIQIRSLPSYDLIDTVHDHRRSGWMREFRFIDHLPHILVACSSVGFTCWDAKARQSLGNCFSLSHFGTMESVHHYNGSDFLCLMKTRSALLVLVAVQLHGPDLPETVGRVCFFPPHLSVLSEIRVNPIHPHIVALSARHGIIQIDISNCILPFTL